MTAAMPGEAFHAHLDVCDQCCNNPFALCSEGEKLLFAAAEGLNPPKKLVALAQWNKNLKRMEER